MSKNEKEISSEARDFLISKRQENMEKAEHHAERAQHYTTLAAGYDQVIANLGSPTQKKSKVVKKNDPLPRDTDVLGELPDYRINMTFWQKSLRTFLLLSEYKKQNSSSDIIDHIMRNDAHRNNLNDRSFKSNIHTSITNLKDWGILINVGTRDSNDADIFKLNSNIPMDALYSCLGDITNPKKYINPYITERRED